tara:strand:+ start:669 stop:2285 length:1617 start_codon:yes stop_codon:yes gene_type:complete
MDKTIELTPQPGMQVQVCESPASELLMGGQAGPGKSWTLLFEDIEDIFRFHDLRILILRRQTTDLGDLTEKAYEMYTPYGATFSAMDRFFKKPTFTFPRFKETEDGWQPIPGTQGAKVVLGHCQHEKDKFNYSGFEFPRIKIDEVAQFTESQYLFLFSRCRSANPNIQATVRSTCNPNGIGMLWVKRRFVEKIPPGNIKAFKNVSGVDTEVPIGTQYSLTRTWIPGDRAENAYVGESYESMLHQLTEEDFNALALGLWAIPDQINQLVRGEWWDFAMSGQVLPLEDTMAMQIYGIGGDFAHQGQDKSVMFVGKGNKPFQAKDWALTTTEEFAYEVYNEARRRGFHSVEVGVDCNGPGVGVGDMLTSGGIFPIKGKDAVVEIKPIKKLFKSIYKDTTYEQDWKYGYKFANLRSQMWWRFREDMEAGNIDLSYFSSARCGFTDVTKLQEEILSHTYEIRNGVIYIVSKNELRKPDKLGRSPDFADALVLWNWVRCRSVDRSLSAAKELKGVDGYMRDFLTDAEVEEDIMGWADDKEVTLL